MDNMKSFAIVNLIAPSRSCHRSPSLSDACRRLCLHVCSCLLSLSSVPCYESYEGPPNCWELFNFCNPGLGPNQSEPKPSHKLKLKLGRGYKATSSPVSPFAALPPCSATPAKRSPPATPRTDPFFPAWERFWVETEIVIHIHGLRCLGHGFLGFLVLPWTRFTVFSRFVSAVFFFFFLWISWAILRLF